MRTPYHSKYESFMLTSKDFSEKCSHHSSIIHNIKLKSIFEKKILNIDPSSILLKEKLCKTTKLVNDICAFKIIQMASIMMISLTSKMSYPMRTDSAVT